MASPFRPGSVLARASDAWNLLRGRDVRSPAPAPFITAFGGASGIQHQFKPMESLEYYGDNPWLYGAVNVIAQEFARVKLYLYSEKKNGEIEKTYDHQALATINRPMPIEKGRSILTHMQLKYLLAQHYLLNGEAFWLLDGRIKDFGGAPTMIHPLMPAFVMERLDSEFNIEAYWYRAAGKQIELDPMDVIHFKLPDPKMWYRGHSPVKSARFALDSHKEADILNTRHFQNSAVPSGVLSTDAKISPEEQKRVADQFNQKYSGSANAGKTVALPSGLKYQRISETNAEMQYHELKMNARDEILANYRVGIEMLGKTEGQTRANADAANYVFQRFTVLPMVEFIVDVLNNDYLPAFPGTEELKFGFEEFVPEDMENKRANATSLFGMGGLTPNEARKEFQKEPIEGMEQADVPYTPFNLVPLTQQQMEIPDIDPSTGLPFSGHLESPEPEQKPKDKEGEEIKPKDGGGDGAKTDEESESKKKVSKAVRAVIDDGSDGSESDLEDDELPPAGKIFDKKKETDIFAAATLPFLIQGFSRGIDIANKETPGADIAPEDIFTKNVRESIATKSLKMSALAMDTMQDDLRKVIDKAIADKVGVQELANRINNLYGSSMGYRSLRIARTELTGSINDGAVQTFREKGFEAKEWSTVLDGHERGNEPHDEFDHHSADGEVVPIDEPFMATGEALMFPGDFGGSPGNIINCRCRAVYADLKDANRSIKKRARVSQAQYLTFHSQIEGRFISTLKYLFTKQRDRILSHFPPLA